MGFGRCYARCHKSQRRSSLCPKPVSIAESSTWGHHYTLQIWSFLFHCILLFYHSYVLDNIQLVQSREVRIFVHQDCVFSAKKEEEERTMCMLSIEIMFHSIKLCTYIILLADQANVCFVTCKCCLRVDTIKSTYCSGVYRICVLDESKYPNMSLLPIRTTCRDFDRWSWAAWVPNCCWRSAHTCE